MIKITVPSRAFLALFSIAGVAMFIYAIGKVAH